MQCIWCDATIFSVNLAFSPEKTRSLILSLSNRKSTKQWSIFSVTLLKLEFDFSLYKSKMLVLFIYLFILVYYSYVDYHVHHVSGTPSWFWGFSHLARLFILLLFPKQWIYDLVVLCCDALVKQNLKDNFMSRHV